MTGLLCGGDLTLLVADSEKQDRALFGFALTGCGLDVWLAGVSDGQEAVDYLRGTGAYADRSLFPLPDMLVIEARMSPMDGYEFLSWRKASSEFRHVPVAVFSSFDSSVDRQRAYELGADACFRKLSGFEEWKRIVISIANLGMRFKRARLAKLIEENTRAPQADQ